LLTVFYFVGLIPIILQVSLSQVTTLALIVGYIYGAILSFAVVNLPKKVPEIWAKSGVHCSNGMLWFAAFLGAGSSIAQFLILSLNQEAWVWWGNLILVVVAFGYAYLREKSGAIHMEISYEAA